MSKISELSDGGVIQSGDTLIAVRSGGNVKVTYGGTTTANIDGGTIDGTVIGGTTPAAGSFTTGSFTGDVSFGDNDKAIFGAGSDLQIYHDGSNSYIDDAGVGDLAIRGNNITLGKYTGEIAIKCVTNGATEIYHDNSNLKLATTATGIDVTGTVTADGLTISNTFPVITFTDTDGSPNYQINSGNGYFRVYDSTNVAQRFRIDNGGDISFYNSAGTTQAFYWDASTSRLGIGTTSPQALLHVDAGAAATQAILGSSRSLYVKSNTTPSNHVSLGYGDNEHIIIDSTGRVGIGTQSPAQALHVASTGSARIRLDDLDTAKASASALLEFTGTDGRAAYMGVDSGSFVTDLESGTRIIWRISGSEAARIDSSGRVGIGATNLIADGLEVANNVAVSGGTTEVMITGNGTSGSSLLALGDGSNRYVQYIESDHSDNSIRFHTAASSYGQGERVRIDSAGNLLVGRTANFSGAKAEIQTNDNTTTLTLNKNNANDGEILRLAKSGSTVGSIGVGSGALGIGKGTGNLGFFDATVVPMGNTSGGASDDVITLGSSVRRFKNLYLSGGVYLGGTGAANQLDDYEEGTFTPTVAGDATGTLITAQGYYTKIGRMVNVAIYLVVGTNFTSSSIGGLPFTVAAGNTGTSIDTPAFVLTNTSDSIMGTPVTATTTVKFYNDGSASSDHLPNTTNGGYRLALSYIA